MRKEIMFVIAIAAAAATVRCSQPQGTLAAARETLGTDALRSIEFSGNGRWFQFGQAPSPTLPWPQFDVSSYTASINY